MGIHLSGCAKKMSLRLKVPLFLQQDTIDHLDRLAHALAKKRGAVPNRSEAVEYLVLKHWKAWQIKRANKRAETPNRDGLVLRA